MRLVSKGVPFDVAFSLPDDLSAAFNIIFGELEGGKWDFDLGDWVKKSDADED